MDLESHTAPTPEQIRDMPYVELLAILAEENRPPGGYDTIRRMALNCHLRPGLSVLHAGCNAGYLSRELARRTGARIVGIDIAHAMVRAADRSAREALLRVLAYCTADMRALPFADHTFDVVLSGGALAFVDGQQQALAEWLRVLKPGGLMADAEFYYRNEPPVALRSQVAQIIGVQLPLYSRSHWEAVFSHPLLDLYYSSTGVATTRTADEVRTYCEQLTVHSAATWSSESSSALFGRLYEIFSLFNQNNAYLDYVLFITRSRPRDAQPTLFG